jgi:UDP-glucose 4-epimerase
VPYETAYGDGYEDMRRRVPDNTRAHELIGFVPSMSVGEIVRSVAESLRSSVNPEEWIMSQAHPDHGTTVMAL